MELKDVTVGKVFAGASGAQKKVTAIVGEEGKAKTINTEIVKQGAGKGKHMPVGTIGKAPAKAFCLWALQEVK